MNIGDTYRPDREGIQDFIADHWLELHDYQDEALENLWRLIEAYAP